MQEFGANKEVFVAAIDNFFEIEKMRFGNDFKVNRTMVEKAYRIFGNQNMIDDYISVNYPYYELDNNEEV